jgi:hypothetical protein
MKKLFREKSRIFLAKLMNKTFKKIKRKNRKEKFWKNE